VFQLVSPVSPPNKDGTSQTFTNAGHTLDLEQVLAPPGAMFNIVDFKTDKSGDFMGGFRLEASAGGGSNNRFLHVLTIDGAATNIMLANTADPTKDIVSMMVGGQMVTMAFNHGANVANADVGGTLTIGSQMHTLGAGLEPLPE
jgi:hypothetical protein